MIFTETALAGAYVIDVEKITDERGFFARSWCRKEFEQHGLNSDFVQCNISYNSMRATLRGMHFQLPPYEEVKLVRCVQGAIYDVIVDLRRDSSSYCHWQAVELNEKNRRALYVPEGFAHGFLTLTDDTEVLYQMSSWYEPDYAKGIRWDDEVIDIKWPQKPQCISRKDLTYPDFVK